MKIGVMSDTHGNRPLMHRVADCMVNEDAVDVIFHLGDNYDDGRELELTGRNVRIIPGLYCDEYHEGRVPNTLIEEFGGLAVACQNPEIIDNRILEGIDDLAVVWDIRVHPDYRHQGIGTNLFQEAPI